MIKIINVVGARPNFMKVAPLVAAMQRQSERFLPLVVHTGQHYDAKMSDLFFRDLELPTPDVYLGVGSASHAAQTASVMERFESVVTRERPDWVLVVGDVNSTMACALVCEARHKSWSRGSGTTEPRPHDARRNQSSAYRSDLGPFVYAFS